MAVEAGAELEGRPSFVSHDPAAPTDDCVIKPLVVMKGCSVTMRDPSLPGGGLCGRIVQRVVAT